MVASHIYSPLNCSTQNANLDESRSEAVLYLPLNPRYLPAFALSICMHCACLHFAFSLVFHSKPNLNLPVTNPTSSIRDCRRAIWPPKVPYRGGVLIGGGIFFPFKHDNDCKRGKNITGVGGQSSSVNWLIVVQSILSPRNSLSKRA